MTTPMRGWSKCIRRGGRRRKPRKGWRRLRRNARRTGSNIAHGDRSLKLSSKRIAIAGLGEIGKTLARKLARVCPASRCRPSRRGTGQGAGLARREGIDCPVIALDELPEHADLAVECAPAAILEQICRPMLEAGKHVMVLSAARCCRGPSSSSWRRRTAAGSSCRPARCSASMR